MAADPPQRIAHLVVTEDKRAHHAQALRAHREVQWRLDPTPARTVDVVVFVEPHVRDRRAQAGVLAARAM